MKVSQVAFGVFFGLLMFAAVMAFFDNVQRREAEADALSARIDQTTADLDRQFRALPSNRETK